MKTPDFDFTEAMRQTVAGFDQLPVSAQIDYYRAKAKADADLYTAALARAEKAEAERDAMQVAQNLYSRRKLESRADRAEGLLKEAVEALRPFSQMAIRNGTTVVCDVSADHVAAARATLAKITKENGQ
jgi:hypothetical protein